MTPFKEFQLAAKAYSVISFSTRPIVVHVKWPSQEQDLI